MSCGNPWRIIAALCLLGLAQRAGAFSLTQHQLAMPEGGFVPCHRVQLETNVFSFVPPAQWRLNVEAEKQKITYQTPTRETTLSIQFTDKNPGAKSGTNSEKLRAELLERFPDAEILESFPCYTNGGQGWAFDLVRTTGGQFKTCIRIGFVPYEGGTVEFTLAALPDQFRQQQLCFGALLTSFGSAPLPPSQ